MECADIVVAPFSRRLEAGSRAFLSDAATVARACLVAASPRPCPRLPVGAKLGMGGSALLQVDGAGTLPCLDDPDRAAHGRWVTALEPLEPGDAPLALSAWKQGLSLARVTLSDKGARGEREDQSGPLIHRMVAGSMDLCHSRAFLLPDDGELLRALLVHLALDAGYDLILTSGGTGVGPRDVTPEATLAVLDKRLPGFERAMTAAGLAKTPHGGISRAVAGTLGRSLVVNLPGSRKAVAENLEAVLPGLGHAVAKLQGDPADCGG